MDAELIIVLEEKMMAGMECQIAERFAGQLLCYVQQLGGC